MDPNSKDSLVAALNEANTRLQLKNEEFEGLRSKLELRMSQDKVLRSLLITKKMAKVFAEILKLLDQIDKYEEANKVLDEST